MSCKLGMRIKSRFGGGTRIILESGDWSRAVETLEEIHFILLDRDPRHSTAGLPRDWGCGFKRVLSGSLIGERRQRGLDREAGKHRGRGRRTQHGGYADRPT